MVSRIDDLASAATEKKMSFAVFLTFIFNKTSMSLTAIEEHFKTTTLIKHKSKVNTPGQILR